MRYALLVHGGAIEEVHSAAERFNTPLTLAGAPGTPVTSFSFASVDVPNVTIETVKRSEDGKNVILRVFEHANRRAKARINYARPFWSVALVNLLEDHVTDLNDFAVESQSITLPMRPFQIVTLRVSGMDAIA